MSPVDFKKWQCPLSLFLFLDLPLDFEIVQCRLSILRNGNVPCHYNFKLFFFFLLLNSVYTVLPLSQGLDRVKGGTNFPVDFKIV